MQQAKQRDLVFDAIKLLAVFLMVWTHALADFRTLDYFDNTIFVKVYSFHMPLFMAMVGYFSESVASKSYPRIIATKFRQLLLPAIAFYAPLAIGVLIKSGPELVAHNYIKSFWFLKSAFICFLLYFTTLRLTGRSGLTTVIISLVISLLITQYSVCKMYPYFLLGIMLRNGYATFRLNAGKIAAASGCVFLVSLIYFDADALRASAVSPLLTAFQTETYDGIFADYLLSLTAGFSGTVFVISLFEALSHRITAGPKGKKIASLGSETLAVYLFQTLFVELPPKYLGNLDDMNDALYTWVLTPLVTVAVVVLTHYICLAIRHSGWLSFLILGKPLAAFGKIPEREAPIDFSGSGR